MLEIHGVSVVEKIISSAALDALERQPLIEATKRVLLSFEDVPSQAYHRILQVRRHPSLIWLSGNVLIVCVPSFDFRRLDYLTLYRLRFPPRHTVALIPRGLNWAHPPLTRTQGLILTG